ncbi:MAG: heavy-metal-associated domain-containing protein [Fermentimonas sp.]|jgi:copper chaperone|nr:heavy-metal-associated domain-containing protein [Fermentimonas sp.]
MKTMKFKTNINCSNCVAKVTPFLDKKVGKEFWNVDIESPDKILSVDTDDLTEEDIVKTVKRTGFEAEAI